MTKRISGKFTPLAIAAAILLSACGAIPTAEDVAQRKSTAIGTVVASETADALLGANYDKEGPRVRCKRMRGTGSNMRVSTCRDPNSGSQPVRVGEYESPILSPTGSPVGTTQRPQD